MLKRLIPVLIIVVAAAALAGALWWGVRSLNPGRYRESLEGWLEDRLNADVQVGVIAPIFYPGLGVQFRDIKINVSDPDGEPGPDSFHAKSLKVVIDHHRLWGQRRLSAKEMILESPVVTFRRASEGQWNLKGVLKKPRHKPCPEIAPKGTKCWIMERLRPYIPKTGGMKEVLLHLERVVINNADLTLKDEKRRKPLFLAPMHLIGVDMILESLENQDAADFVLNTIFPQTGATGSRSDKLLEIKGKLVFDPAFQGLRLEDLRGGWGANNIINSGMMRISRGDKGFAVESDLNLDLLIQEIRGLVLSLPIKRSDLLEKMSFAGKGQVALSLKWPAGKKKPHLSYKLKAVLFDSSFDPGMVIAPISGFSGTASIKDGTVRIPDTEVIIAGKPIKAELVYLPRASWSKAQSSQYPEFYINTSGGGIDLGRLFYSRSSKEPPGVAGQPLPPMRTRWGGMVAITKANYKDFQIEKLNGEWRFINRILFFPNLSLKACDARYEDVASWVDFSQRDSVMYMIEGKTNGMKLARLFKELFGIDFFIDGRTYFDGYVFGGIKEGQFNMRSLNGKFKVKIKRGEFIGYSMGARLLGFLGVPLDQEKYGRYFEKLKAEMIIRDGVVYFDDIVIRNWNLEAHAAGSVNLVKEKLDLWVAVYPLEGISTVTKPIPLIGDLINIAQEALFGYYARVKGAWHKPEFRTYIPLIEKIPECPKPRPKPETPEVIKSESNALPIKAEKDKKR